MSSFEDSDDEYAPVAITSWGNQAGENKQDTAPSWNDLVDPNFKVAANGLGGGNLHRQGSNYKPVSEQHILNQRLGIPNPQKKKKQPHSGASRGSATRKPPSTRPVTTSSFSRPPAQTRPTYPSTTRAPPPSTTRPPPSGNSAWTSGTLVDVPFWEKGNHKHATAGGGWNNERPDVPANWDAEPQNTRRQQSSLNNKPDVPASWTDAPQQQPPLGMRPPPGLFKSAVTQLKNENAPHPPPGLAPVPNHHHPSQQRQSGYQQESYRQQQSQRPSEQQQPGHQQRQSSYQQQRSSYQQQQQPSYQQPQQQSQFGYQQPNFRQQQHTYSQQPTNYQQQQQVYHQMEPPTPAPTPPKQRVSNENPVVITINMELEVNTIAVPLRLQDDPHKIAEAFSYQNGITDANIIKSLRDIFSTQHRQAIQKRNVNSFRH